MPRNWRRPAESILFLLALPPFLLPDQPLFASGVSENSSRHCLRNFAYQGDTQESVPCSLSGTLGISLRFSLPIFQKICIRGCTAGSCSEFRDILRLRMLAAPRTPTALLKDTCSSPFPIPGTDAPSLRFSFLRFLSLHSLVLLPLRTTQSARSKIGTQLISRDYHATDVTEPRGCSFTAGSRLAGIRIYRRDEFNRGADNCL